MATFGRFNSIENRKGKGSGKPPITISHNADLVSDSPDGFRVFIYTTTGSTRNFSISGLQKDISINLLVVGGGGERWRNQHKQ